MEELPALRVRAKQMYAAITTLQQVPWFPPPPDHMLEPARFVDELAGGRSLHVVLAADLDADPETASARFWTGRQALDGTSVCYRDAWESAHPGEPGDTVTPENPLLVDWDWPFRRIDYIFVRCGAHGGPTLEVKRCERIFDEPVDGVWASDHYGVMAELAVPRRRDSVAGGFGH
jgi:endonuclease/exonuclease/phosphatase family metal-dependent hydrolase